MRTIAIIVATGLLATLGACGGDGGRPSVEEVAGSLTADDSLVPVPEQLADCFAAGLVDSALSDETLRAIADRDEEHDGSAAEQELLVELTGTLTDACADQGPGPP